jgi:hypothetical protein
MRALAVTQRLALVQRAKKCALGGVPTAQFNWDLGYQPALKAVAPIINFLLSLILRITVFGLDLSFQLLTVAVDLSKLVVGQLAPLPWTRSQFIAALLLAVARFSNAAASLTVPSWNMRLSPQEPPTTTRVHFWSSFEQGGPR